MHATLLKFKYPDLLVKDYKHWAQLIRYDHVTLGSMVIVAKSDDESLGALSADAWKEFSLICREAESALMAAFNAERFNYLALMMTEHPHVHFHLIPRYSKPVTFNDKEYTDPEWPTVSALKAPNISDADLASIQGKLIQTIG